MRRRKSYKKRHKFTDYLSVFTLFAILAISVAWFEQHNAEHYSGQFTVVDGDSLKQGDLRIRLVGIDAPEFDQLCQKNNSDYACGRIARDHLRSLMKPSDDIKCIGEGEDKYGRLLAECFARDQSLNGQMVADGWAVSYGGYGWLERQARTGKLGLWQGKFNDPSDWRARTGGLFENRSGAALRNLWRWTKGWSNSLFK